MNKILVPLVVLLLLVSGFLAMVSRRPAKQEPRLILTTADLEAMEKAEKNLDAGKYAEALALISGIKAESLAVTLMAAEARARLKKTPEIPLAELEKRVQRDPQPEMRFRLARVIDAHGDRLRARELLEALAQNKGNPLLNRGIRLRLFQLAIADKRVSEAVKSAETLAGEKSLLESDVIELIAATAEAKSAADLERLRTVSDPLFEKKPDYRKALGNAYVKLGELQTAVKFFDALRGTGPEDVGLRLNVADLLRRQGKTVEAHAQLEKILAVRPPLPEGTDWPKTFLKAGMEAGDQGRLDTAFRFLRRAVLLNPEFQSPDPYFKKIGPYLAQKGTPEEKKFFSCFMDYYNGDFAAAAENVENLWKTCDSPADKIDLGLIKAGCAEIRNREAEYQKQLEQAKAEKAYEAAAELAARLEALKDPRRHVTGRAGDGNGPPFRHNESEAVKKIKNEFAARGHSPAFLFADGTALLSLQDTEGAKFYLQALVKIDPATAPAQLLLGDIALGENRPGEAREHFENAMKINPQDDKTRGKLALVLVETDPARAQQEAQEAIRLNPHNADARLALGRCLFKAGRISEARDHVDQGLLALEDSSSPTGQALTDLKTRLSANR